MRSDSWAASSSDADVRSYQVTIGGGTGIFGQGSVGTNRATYRITAKDGVVQQDLIDKLRDLSATKFAETGGGSPVFEATVMSNGGKRTEKVTVSKQGDQFFAQRDGESSIYVLDGKAVEDLQKAAADVKEAPAEQPKKK